MNQDKRRNEILTKLMTMEGQTKNKTWQSWIGQVVDFIKEQK